MYFSVPTINLHNVRDLRQSAEQKHYAEWANLAPLIDMKV